MVLGAIIELTVSVVGVYNLAKGAYNMYCDVDKIKKQYRDHQHITEEYRRSQVGKGIDHLTDSQYHRYEGEFIVLEERTILDPYRKNEN